MPRYLPSLALPALSPMPVTFPFRCLLLCLLCAHAAAAFGQTPPPAEAQRRERLERIKALLLAGDDAAMLRPPPPVPQPPSENPTWEGEDALLAQARDLMRRGGTKLLATKAHPKARGLDLTLQHPAAWTTREADSQDTLQELGPASGDFRVALAATPLQDLPGRVLPAADPAALLTPDALRRHLPDTATFISGRTLVIDARPACELRFSQVVQQDGFSATQVITALFFIRQHVLVRLDGIVPATTTTTIAAAVSEAEVARLSPQLARLNAMLQVIARTVVVQPPPGAAAAPAALAARRAASAQSATTTSWLVPGIGGLLMLLGLILFLHLRRSA